MKVRVIAVNPKYRTLPYYMTPVFDEEIKDYRTGQENLTPAELKKQPFIVDPEKQYPIRHHQELNLDNPKDKILYQLAIIQADIANNSKSVQSGHVMYLENLEAEATERVSNKNKFFNALTRVKETDSIEQSKNLGIFLGINVSQPLSVVYDRIYSACENTPADVMKFFSGNHDNRLFVLKLKHYGILQSRNGFLYDNDILVGKTTEDATTFVQEEANNQLVAKWGLALDDKEGRTRKPLGKTHDDKLKAEELKKEEERLKNETIKNERLEKERLEKERLEKEEKEKEEKDSSKVLKNKGPRTAK